MGARLRTGGGCWRVHEVAEPDRFTFDDYFAHDDLTPNTDLPVTGNTYRFAPTEAGTRATFVSTFANADDMQRVLDMGVVEGATSAINQIDGLLGR